jgi:hypothetical protein
VVRIHDRPLLAALLRHSGLPSLGPPLDEPRAPLCERLRWRAATEDVLFHGSSNPDLRELAPIRRSRDKTAFGDQQAVYATSDPVWATFFAVLRRGRVSMRNASLGLAGESLYPRWYFFSINRPDGGEHFAPGSLYVLPRTTFTCQSPLLGKIDTAQWVSHEAVPVLERIDVTPADFPLADLVVMHREREPIVVTIARAIRSARAQPSAGGQARSRRARAR